MTDPIIVTVNPPPVIEVTVEPPPVIEVAVTAGVPVPGVADLAIDEYGKYILDGGPPANGTGA